jgi:hypothetical protein
MRIKQKCVGFSLLKNSLIKLKIRFPQDEALTCTNACLYHVKVAIDGDKPAYWLTCVCRYQYGVEGYDVGVCSCGKTSLCNTAAYQLPTLTLPFSILLLLLAL